VKVRFALPSDKENVLRFCANTFEWGDYIAQVWDSWYLDQNGVLLVAEDWIRHPKSKTAIAISHASLCPNRNVWIEGIRVDPNYRRKGIAFKLLNEMLVYGKQHGAREAVAIVSINNKVSKLMMEKAGFNIMSKWSYYRILAMNQKVDKEKDVKIATYEDISRLWNYLNFSTVFEASIKHYVKSWRWYVLDFETLVQLVNNRKIVIICNDDDDVVVVEGIAVIESEGHYKTDNKNSIVLQITYVYVQNNHTLTELVSFVKRNYEDNAIIQVFSTPSNHLSSDMKKFKICRFEDFLLYCKPL
jgi:ribosomal protein S18 acetylase RimI-like enzyme